MEPSEFEHEHERTATPIFRKDRHLSTALIVSEIQYILRFRDNPRALKREHRQLVQHLQTDNIAPIHPRYAYSWFMNNHDKCVRKSHRAELGKIMESCQLLMDISILDYTGRPAQTEIVLTPIIYHIYDVKCEFDELFDKVTFNRRFFQKWKLGRVQGYAYGNLHLISLGGGEWFLLTHAHLAGIRDMFNSWFDILLYGAQYQNKYQDHNLLHEIEFLIQSMSIFTKEHPEFHHSLLKAWPSLAIASILRDTEFDDRFLRSLEPSFTPIAHTAVYQHLTRRVDSSARAHILLELSGLWKCFGHPIIDMDASVKAWITKGALLKPDVGDISQELGDMFTMTFCRNFYKKRRTWPVVTTDSEASPRVIANIHNGTWRENVHDPWKAREFRGVKLQQNFTFDYHVDISDLLSDKSIIPRRSEWIHEYDKQAHRSLYGRFPEGPAPTSKSVIVKYLETESISVADVMNTISTLIIPLEWRVIVGVAKEREQKEANARFYAKMTFEMRLFQTVTESNIADQVFPFIPQQSMTMKEDQLIRIIHRMTTPKHTVTGADHVFIVVDFSSWCTQFRYEVTQDIFQSLDRLFGVENYYTFTHLFPIMSVLIFQDRFTPPQQGENGDPLEGPRCYHGPEAWQEGLRQKGWTIITIMLILLVAERCETSASLLGQGDNQVILLRIPPPGTLQRLGHTKASYTDHFVECLSREADRAGTPIKIEETWRSTHLFEYSREYHYRGAQVSSSLKRISRLASEANQSIPSLNSDLSGLYSTGAAAASKDLIPCPSYLCTVIEALHAIQHKMPWLKKEHSMVSTAGLLVTRMLGGLPIEIYPQFCTRAVQDILSTNVHLLKTAARWPGMIKHLDRWLCMQKTNYPDYETLIKDPQSLPLTIPSQPESIVRRTIREGVPMIVQNTLLKELFNCDMNTHKQQLVSTLMSIRPVNPRLLNKLYALSNPGLQESYLGRFSNTRSIQRVAFDTWADELELLSWIQHTELTISNYYQSRGHEGSYAMLMMYCSGCVTVGVQRLRADYWGYALEGITMAPQQEQTTLRRWDEIPEEWEERCVLVLVDPSVRHNLAVTKGQRNPYFGSETRLRARRAPLQVMEVGNMVSSIKQLMEIHGWVQGDDSLQALIETLITEKTDIPMETLLQYTRPIYSGTLSHRLTCPALRRGGMANTSLNFASHCLINSDTATKYAKQGTNYTICFQSVFLKELSVLSQLNYLGHDVEGSWAIVFSCESCTQEIPAETFTLSENLYPGASIPLTINNLTPKFQPRRLVGISSSVGGARAYSVHLARKFTLWLLSHKQCDHLTTIESRPVEDTLTASFINLTEFKALDCYVFLNSLVYYHFLYSEATYDHPYSIWAPLTTGSREKIPYDLLLDAMVKCDLVSDLVMQTNACYSSPGSALLLRSILAECISRALQGGSDRLILAHSILTPEDTKDAYIRATKLILRSLHLELSSALPSEPGEIQDWLDSHQINVTLTDYLKITVSEEECIAEIRATKVQRRQLPQGRISMYDMSTCATIRPKNSGKLVLKEVNHPHMMWCNPTVYPHWTFVTAHIVKSVWMKRKRAQGSVIHTWNDPHGMLYAFLWHVLDRLDPNKSGPLRDPDGRDIAEMLERGPTACSLDVCGVTYNRLAYNRLALNSSRAVSCDLMIIVGSDHSVMPILTPGSLLIQECRLNEPLLTYNPSYEIKVSSLDTKKERVWIISTVLHGDPRHYPNIPPLNARPIPCAHTVAEAIQRATELLEGGPSCGSVLQWAVSRIGILPRTLNSLVGALTKKLQLQQDAYHSEYSVIIKSRRQSSLAVLTQVAASRRSLRTAKKLIAQYILLLNVVHQVMELQFPWKYSLVYHDHGTSESRYPCMSEDCGDNRSDYTTFLTDELIDSHDERMWRILIRFLRNRAPCSLKLRVPRLIDIT